MTVTHRHLYSCPMYLCIPMYDVRVFVVVGVFMDLHVCVYVCVNKELKTLLESSSLYRRHTDCFRTKTETKLETPETST